MDFRISVNELSRALNISQGVVPKKHTMPILSNVLISANSQNQNIELHATDLDTGVQLKRKCEVNEPGSTSVSSRALLDIVKMLPGPDVCLKTMENGHLSIKSGRTQARLMALNANEFPRLPDGEGLYFQKIQSSLFLSMVQRTIYSTSIDESRYNLTGVYFEPQKDDGKSLVMVATDGHRLSRIKEEFANGDFRELGAVTLPRKGLIELMKLLESHGEGTEEFQLGFSENHAIVKMMDAHLSMRLIEGKFPDYTQVIPRLADKILRASRHDFLLSVKRVSVLAIEKTQSVKLKTINGELTISCVNPETGEVTDDVPVEYNGPNIEIGFNAKYVIEALSSILDNNIMIKFTDAISPTLITGLKGDSHQCVIMPMRM